MTFTLKAATVPISRGDLGTKDTLQAMKKIIQEYKKTPLIRHLALEIIKGVPPREYRLEAKKIFEYVRDNINFVRDVLDVETLQTPDVTLKLKRADCDDYVTLLGSLLAAIGHKVRMVAIGVRAQAFEHVFLEDKIQGTWTALDASGRNYPFGWKYPTPQRVIYQGV